MNARLRPIRSPILLPIRMNAADTSASRAIALWTLLAVVPRSCTTAEIDTFISDVSTTSTNIAIARRIARLRSPAAASAGGVAPFSVTARGSRPPGRVASPRVDDARASAAAAPRRAPSPAPRGTPSRAGSCPTRAAGRSDEHRRPCAPPGGERPVPEELEEAPAGEHHQVAGPVAAEARLLDEDRAGGLQLTDQERHEEERSHVPPGDQVEQDHRAQDSVAGDL